MHTTSPSDGRTRSVLSGLLGIVLIVAALAKLASPQATTESIASYIFLNSRLGLGLLVLLLSILEFAVGLVLVARSRIKIWPFAPVTALILLSTLWGVGLSRSVLGIGESCGCFGSLSALSTPTGAMIRDSAILALAIALCIKEKVPRITNVGYAAMIVASMALGIWSVNVVNRLYQNHDIIVEWKDNVEDTWFGIRANKIGGRTLENLAIEVFGSNPTLVPSSRSSMFQQVVSKNGDATLGWVVGLALPYSRKMLSVFRIAIVYDSELRILRLFTQPPHKATGIEWPSQLQLEAFQDWAIGNTPKRLLPLNATTPKLSDSLITAILVGVINNSTYNLLMDTVQ